MKGITKITVQIIAGANIATILLLIATGYSYLINPVGHPYWAVAGLAFPVFLLINFGFFVFWIIFKLRWALIPFVGFLICYLPIRIYIPFNLSKDTPEGALKVLSYNVYNFAADSENKAKGREIIDYISNQNADIVCLQESEAQHKSTQMYLDSVMNTHYKYKDIETNATYGGCISIYSKYPIVSRYKIKYESIYNSSVAYKIKIGRDTVVVINNHLEATWLSEEERANFKQIMKGNLEKERIKNDSHQIIKTLGSSSATRSVQADSVANFIAAHSNMSVICCGDFNDSPISYVRHTIAKNLTDCYVSTANGPGISYHGNRFYVRIDNIMCSKNIKPFGCEVDNSIKASDHYPIYCWLKIGSKP